MILGTDGGINTPYIIQEKIGRCVCCGRQKDLRMGVCFDCAECESVIIEGLDMYDNPIKNIENHSLALAKVKYIIEKFREVK